MASPASPAAPSAAEIEARDRPAQRVESEEDSEVAPKDRADGENASQSEDSTGEDMKPVKRKVKRANDGSKKKKRKTGLEEEAERSDDGGSSDEDEDEGPDDYDYDDFVVKDASDVDSDDNAPKKKPKNKNKLSKLKKKKERQLDEEDLELVRANREQLTRDQETLKNTSVSNYRMDDEDDDEGAEVIERDDDEEDDKFIDRGAAENRPRPRPKVRGQVMKGFIEEPTEDQKLEAIEIFGAGFDEFDSDEEDEVDEQTAHVQHEREAERRKHLAAAKGVYEFSQLVENFRLEDDERIRAKDVPERYQLSMKGREAPTDDERKTEARWMAMMLSEKIISSRPRDVDSRDTLAVDLLGSIETVLRLIQVEHLEVPFIWLYRRDYLHPVLMRDDLWTILALDERWETIYGLRHRLIHDAHLIYASAAPAAEGGDEDSAPKSRGLYDEAARLFPRERFQFLVNECYDESRLRDVFNFLRLLVTDYDRVRSEYNKFKRVPCMRRFAEALVHPSYMIGSFLAQGYKVEPPSFYDQKVEDVAREVAAQFGYQGSNMLAAAEVIISTELSHEPVVRGLARIVFKTRGTVSTKPTASGAAAITPFSEHFGIHLIQDKPLSDFETPEGLLLFMRMLQAEEEKLITIEINPTMTVDSDGVRTVDPAPFMFTEVGLFKLLLPSSRPDQDHNPEARKSFDAVRMKILKTCVEQYLVPSLRKEIKRELVHRGREVLIEAMATNFHQKLTVGPFLPGCEDLREVTRTQLLACPDRPFEGSVGCIYQASERQASISLVFLDKDGVVIAQDIIPFKTIAQRKERIKHFLFEWKPDVIALNSSGGEFSKSIAMEIEKAAIQEVNDLLELQARERVHADEDDAPPQIERYAPHVVIVDDSVANVFKSSARAKKLFPDMLPESAAAVSMGRMVLEPLGEYCLLWRGVDSTCLFGYEAMFLTLHPLQRLVSNQRKKVVQALECQLVNAVCDVGVDLNRACSLDHVAPMLAFVAGLGLRKADALRHSVLSAKIRVGSRIALRDKKLLGDVVWTNAAGFLRVTASSDDHRANPLDNTRIHPELYLTHTFTQKICTDALETEDNDPTEYFDTITRLMAEVRGFLEKRLRRHPMWLDAWAHGRPKPGAFEYVGPHGSPHTMDVELNDCLSLLMLDEYAQEVERMGQGKRRLVFELIKDELRYPWLDLRRPLASLTNGQMFDVVCRNAGQQLAVGLKVGCTVLELEDTSFMDRDGYARRVQKAVVRTDSGLKGSISAYELLDERVDMNSINVADYLQPGAHVLAVLVGMQKERFRLGFSLKPSVVHRSEAYWIENRDQDNYCRRWWEGLDGYYRPEDTFDRYFCEREALDTFKASEVLAGGHDGHLGGAGMGGGGMGGAGGGPRGVRAMARVVHHPLFANVDFKTAEERLRSDAKGAGAVLVRPSAKGPNFLTLTWAFRHDLFKHISIEERDKRSGDLGLSNQLWVAEDDIREPYSDLDELFVRYVEPMNDLVSAMVKHKNFHSGSPEEVEAQLRRQHQEQPTRIPYFVRFEPSRPGAFVLSWLSVSSKTMAPTVKTLRVEVRPTGYRVGEKLFGRPSELIVWFKQMNEQAVRQQQTAPAPRRPSRFGQVPSAAVAAMAVPPPLPPMAPYGGYPPPPAPPAFRGSY